MKCPVCKTRNLHKVLLESELPALGCERCEGNWINGSVYWKWIETDKHESPVPENSTEASVVDVEQAKLCPECRHIMVKYWLSSELDFALDHCHGCRGIWFDRNEWNVLKGRHLHNEINSIFTSPWQTEVERARRKLKTEQHNESKFGAEDYAEMKRIRLWISRHPRREEILAFLNDRNPPGS